DGVAGRRASGAGVRAARARPFRRSPTQDDRNLASRWLAADLGHRGDLRGRPAGLRLDAARAQGGRPQPRSTVRPAQRHGRPGRGLGSAVARRGEDLRAGDPDCEHRHGLRCRPVPRRHHRGRAHPLEREGHDAGRRVVDARERSAQDRARV
ncbi:MAG: hypthetical protein SCD63.18c, partial [uncultured Nocardioidaceae bacterium]